MLGDAVVVDEAAARLVQRRHEAGVVVEGGEDQGVVLAVHLQDGLHIHLGVLRGEGRVVMGYVRRSGEVFIYR